MVLQLLLLFLYSRLLMKVSSNRKLAFMLFRELLGKSKGSLFNIHCWRWTSINEM
nr:MAG TPA: hypothetical protein [Caudoviricetes sp.]